MSITVNDIITLMRTRGRGDPPSALADVFVGPLFSTLDFIDAKITFAQSEQALDAVLQLLEDTALLNTLSVRLGESVEDLTARLRLTIDNIASNFGLTRRVAAASSGNIQLLRTNALNVPPDSAITVASGRRVAAPYLNQEYQITETHYVTSMTYHTTLQKYIYTVPVESIDVGLNTVTASGQVSRLVDALGGIDGVTNIDAITGGRDAESDRDFVTRIKTALSANNIGTLTGYRNMVLAIDNVKDAYIVGASSPYMVRDIGDGGSVDIYIADPINITVSDLATASNFVSLGGGQYRFTPSRKPLIDDVTTITPTPISITKDVGVYAESINAQDYIIFDTDYTSQTITYQVDNLVQSVHDYVNDDARKILGSDVLVKAAESVLVDVIMTIKILAEFANSRSTVQANVENAITQFIDNLLIGASLEQSDIIGVVTDVAGVDRVNLPLTKFERSAGTGTVNIVTANASQILRAGTILVNF